MSVAFSPDGKSLAAGYGRYSSQDTGHVRLWDVATGTALGDKFAAVRGGVNSVSFHPDGRRVALAGFGHVEIWDMATRARLVDLPGHTKWVYCAAFSPDGTRLATGGFDQTVKLWDPATGAEVRTLYGHKSFVRGVAFSPDGKLLASVSEGKDVRLWEVATGRELATFHGHSSFRSAVAFHPDGRRIASGGADGTVKIWDVRRSRPVVFRGHTGWVTRVAFRRDGRRVASETGDELESRTGDETIKVWDPATGEEDPSPAGAGTIADLGPDFGPGGKHCDGWPDRGSQSDQPRRPSDRDRRVRRAGRARQGCGHRPGPDHPEGAHRSDLVHHVQPRREADRHGRPGSDDQDLGRRGRPGSPHAPGPHPRRELRGLQPRRPPPRLGRRRHHGPGLGCDPVLVRRPARAGGPQDGLPPTISGPPVQGRADRAAPRRRDSQRAGPRGRAGDRRAVGRRSGTPG